MKAEAWINGPDKIKSVKRTPPLGLILYWSQSDPGSKSLSPPSPRVRGRENPGIKVGGHFLSTSFPAPLTALQSDVQLRGYSQTIWMGLFITLLETLTLDQNVQFVIPYFRPDLLFYFDTVKTRI